MGTESLLGEYLEKTKAAESKALSSETIKRIESIFDELGVPWKRDDDVWVITSDVGEVRAAVDDDEDVLSFWQLQFPLDKHPKKNGELFDELLRMNADSAGAAWAVKLFDDGTRYVIAISRIAAQNIDPPEVALALSAVFDLASVTAGD